MFGFRQFAPNLLQSRTVLSLVRQMSGAAFGTGLRGRFWPDRVQPAWSGCVMTCFCCITGTTIFILFPNMSLNRLGFAMVTVGTDIVHWLYFHYICSL